MIFTKDIKIKAKDLKGPPGAKEIYVVLGFDQGAITTHNSEFDGTAWQYVVHPVYYYLNE